MMTKQARVACSRRSFSTISLVLFGLAGAVACSGQGEQKATQKAAVTGDAGAPITKSSEQSLAVVRQLGAERSSLGHLSLDAPSGLRLHGSPLIPNLVDPGRPFIIDAEV